MTGKQSQGRPFVSLFTVAFFAPNCESRQNVCHSFGQINNPNYVLLQQMCLVLILKKLVKLHFK